jgi:hypothetical protein
MSHTEVEGIRIRALNNAYALVVLKREMEQIDEVRTYIGQDASYGDILRSMSEDDFNSLLVLLRMRGEQDDILQILREARQEVVTGKVGGVF